jgi:hypothetical protein
LDFGGYGITTKIQRYLGNLFRVFLPFRVFRVSVFCLLLGLLTSGCITLHDPEAGQEFRADIVSNLKAGGKAGQTIISRRARLNSRRSILNRRHIPQSGRWSTHSP